MVEQLLESGGKVVAVANAVIWHNERRKEVLLVADQPQGGAPAPDAGAGAGLGAEVRWLTGEMRWLRAAGVPRGDMAVLVRKNRHKLPLLAALAGAMFFLSRGVTVRVTYSEEQMDERWGEVEWLVAAIRGGEWDPTPGSVCGRCPFGEMLRCSHVLPALQSGARAGASSFMARPAGADGSGTAGRWWHPGSGCSLTGR